MSRLQLRALHKWFFLIPFLSIFFYCNAQPKQFYIEIKDSQLIIGQYEGKNWRPKQIAVFENSDIDSINLPALLSLKPSTASLFYFHALLGNLRPYHKKSLKKLATLQGVDQIISIIWHPPKMNYRTSWDRALDLGAILAPLFQAIWYDTDHKNHVLCHSMGHRIFEGILAEMSSNDIRLSSVILAAADLDIDVFDKNFTHLKDSSTSVFVFVHHKDRLLKTSSKKLQRKRLGLHGMEMAPTYAEYSNLKFIDLTNSPDAARLRYTNHNYWRKDARVWEIIQTRF